MSGKENTGGEVGEHKTFARERIDFIRSAAISLHNLNEGPVVEGRYPAGRRGGLSELGVSSMKSRVWSLRGVTCQIAAGLNISMNGN